MEAKPVIQYDVIRNSDGEKLAMLEYDPVTEQGFIIYTRWNLRVDISGIMFHYVCDNLVETGATLRIKEGIS